jgi:hypothetical protein
MGIMRQEDALDRAKAAGKGEELRWRETLLPHAEHRPGVQRGFQGGKGGRG